VIKKSSKSVRRKSALKSVGQTASRRVAPSIIPSIAAQLPTVGAEQMKAAKKKFEEGIISRGEAVPLGKPLPPGATHEITSYEADGTPILKRKRFSMR
jgi:hypothetical protein